MNIQEHEEALRKISPEELKKFNEDYGGGDLTVEQRVRNFVDESKHEAQICQLLNLKTESQKVTDATVKLASSQGGGYLKELESQVEGKKKMPNTNIRLFVSHSSRDVTFVEALIDLLRAALNLDVSQIRCTSVDGYRLPGGADTNEQLKQEVYDAESFIGVISTDSIRSIYVVFELGARWGAKRSLIPLIAPGSNTAVLRGPLSGINALNSTSRSQLSQLLDDLSRELSLILQPASSFQRHIDTIINLTSTPSEIIEETEPVLKKSDYELVKTEGGAVVYKSKAEPAHFACPSCFKSEIHILQDRRNVSGLFICPGCKTAYPVEPATTIPRKVISEGINI